MNTATGSNNATTALANSSAWGIRKIKALWRFLKTIQDPLLPTKVLIKKAIENKLISNKGNYLYLKSDNSPLCEINEEPTLNVAAKFLSSPKNQDLKFSLEAKLK